MVKSNELINAWKEFLTAALSQNLGIDIILSTFQNNLIKELGSTPDEHGWFILDNKVCKIGWRILNNKEKREPEDAIPIEIALFGEDGDKEWHVNLLDYFEEHMLEKSITIIQKATFEII